MPRKSEWKSLKDLREEYGIVSPGFYTPRKAKIPYGSMLPQSIPKKSKKPEEMTLTERNYIATRDHTYYDPKTKTFKPRG